MTQQPLLRSAAIGLLAVTFVACPGAPPPAPAPPSFEEEALRSAGRDGDATIGTSFESVALEGTANGRRDASGLGIDCRGFVLDEGVNHVLTLTEARPLTFRATPRGFGVADLFIAISSNGSSWVCADDGDGLNPVHAAIYTSGEVRILVGTTDATVVPYTLDVLAGLQEGRSVSAGSHLPAAVGTGNSPERTDDGTFGGARIPSDTAPITMSGRAGGTRRGVDIEPGCVGYVAQTPDHTLEVEAAQPLLLRVRSDGDATLIVQGPGPTTFCTDDDEGLDPVLRIDATPGRYSVYVGAYDQTDAPSYNLTVSR